MQGKFRGRNMEVEIFRYMKQLYQYWITEEEASSIEMDCYSHSKNNERKVIKM